VSECPVPTEEVSLQYRSCSLHFLIISASETIIIFVGLLTSVILKFLSSMRSSNILFLKADWNFPSRSNATGRKDLLNWSFSGGESTSLRLIRKGGLTTRDSPDVVNNIFFFTLDQDQQYLYNLQTFQELY